jgi:drug/metabolite transporter (DMT)-like permease
VIATLGGMIAPADPERRGQLLVAAAAISWSSAGPVQRAVDATPATQVAIRAGVGAIALAAYLVARRRGGTAAAFRSVGRAGLAVAILLALVTTAFIFALDHTSVAHVLLWQASSPFLAALLAWLVIHERIPPRTWLAMGAALAGVAVMVGGSLGSGSLRGDALCVVMSAGFAGVIVITRRHREISMTPATALGMAIAFVATAPFSHWSGLSAHDALLLAALGAGQIALGLILFTAGARLISAAQAGLIALLEVVLGPIWVWLLYSERPETLTLAGGSVIVAAVLLHALAELRPASLRARSEAL